MEIIWHTQENDFDVLWLVGDVGGTNTNLAIAGKKEEKFGLLVECVFPSDSIDGLIEPLLQTLSTAKERFPDLKVASCCISAAGPVQDNKCVLTNCNWNVDGADLESILKMPVLVINDFLAISYGIPTLDVNDPEQIHAIEHLDGSKGKDVVGNMAVIGPGTGMGVSYLVWDGSKHIPASSEGGHITYAPFDEESAEFQKYMAKKIGNLPGVEPLVSGTGFQNIYEFYRDTKGLPTGGIWDEMVAAPAKNRPKLISMASDTEPMAASMMRLFVKMLARYVSDLTAVFMPVGGMYLAGGVVMKDLRWLLKDNLFMEYFEQNYNKNLVPFLQGVPVYVIRDYSISLFGAANAANSIL